MALLVHKVCFYFAHKQDFEYNTILPQGNSNESPVMGLNYVVQK